MKTRIIRMALCVPFIIGAAHAQYAQAETLYFYSKDSSASYLPYNDPYNYVDSSGNRPEVEPDWNNLYDIVVNMDNLNNDHVGFLSDNWKINSLTFNDATGSWKQGHYWWDQTQAAGAADGKTLEIANDLNFYNSVACGLAKKFNMEVGGGINIDIRNDFGDRQVNFTGLLSLDVKNDFTVRQFGASQKGAVYFGPYYSENGVTHKGTVSIGGNLDVTGVSAFEFIKCSSLVIGQNVTFTSSDSARLAESDYVHIGGNLLANAVNNVYMHSNAYTQIDGSVDIYKSELRIYGDRHTVKIGRDLTSHDSAAHIYADRTTYLEVLGNVSTEGNFENRDAGYTYINGDLSIGSASVFKTGNFTGKDSDTPQSESNAGLEIGGIINIGGGRLENHFTTNTGTAPNETRNLFVSAGGISGSGNIQLYNPKSPEEEYSVTYVLNNAENSSFSGGITYGTSAVDFGKMRLNIIKKGGGTQTFIINNASSVWAGTVTMREGVLNLYANSSSNVKIDLVLENGGALAVSYAKEGKHDPSADYMGVIYANSLAINGDSKIIFDAVNTPGIGYESDMIIAGDVSGEGIATLVIDLDTETFDPGEIISDMTLEIFRAENNNSYDWAKAVLKVMYGGGDITGKFSKLVARVEGNSVYIDLAGVVPEPAAAAAILGAIAIALAAYRRRKR